MPDTKVKVATVWLDGCSGCHMSILDMDERLIELAEVCDFVYTPLVDNKEYPPDVDVAIVEGAVSTDEDEHKIKMIRERTKIIIALGDCAVAGNVPTMRNRWSVQEVMERAYIETADIQAQLPDQVVPTLLPVVRPMHEVVSVDVYLQGCPPPADQIYYVLSELVAGRQPDLTGKMRPGQ